MLKSKLNICFLLLIFISSCIIPDLNDFFNANRTSIRNNEKPYFFKDSTFQIIYYIPDINLPSDRVATFYDYRDVGLWLIDAYNSIKLKKQLNLSGMSVSESYWNGEDEIRSNLKNCRKRIDFFGIKDYTVSPDGKYMIILSGSVGLGMDFYLYIFNSDTLIKITDEKYNKAKDINEPWISDNEISPIFGDIVICRKNIFIYLVYNSIEEQFLICSVNLTDILQSLFDMKYDSLKLPLKPIVLLKSKIELRYPAISHDGNKISYFKYNSKEFPHKNWKVSGLYIYDVLKNTEKRLIKGFVRNIKWYEDELYYLKGYGNYFPYEENLMKYNYNYNKETSLVTGIRIHDYDIHFKSNKIAYTKVLSTIDNSGFIFDLYYYDLNDSMTYRVEPGYIKQVLYPNWSDDGNYIGFVALEEMDMGYGNIQELYSVKVLDIKNGDKFTLTDKFTSKITSLKCRY